MRLKGKLFITFGSVLIFSLVVLGLIIHFSFLENTIRNWEEILQLKTNNISYHLNYALELHTENIQHTLMPYLHEGRIDKQRIDEATKKLTSIIQSDRLINDIIITESKNRKIILHTSRHAKNSYTVPPQALTYSNNSFSLISVDDKLLLSWLPFPDHKSLIATIELDRQEFKIAFHPLLAIDQAIFLLIDDNKQTIITIDHAEGLACDNFDVKLASTCNHGISSVQESDSYLYRHKQTFLGNHAYVLVNKKQFFKQLHSLNNRIITGILIVGWVFIWVILVFAHKISSPITKLSKITNDLIIHNYDSELQAHPSSDEIGELYQNFETMRRKLKDLINNDPLTNVYNRRYLMHVFELNVNKALRLEQPLSCIMFDLDFFKKVNDHYGHQCGDMVLKEIGRIIKEAIRPYDIAARYGGEEFIILLPETDNRQAYAMAERLRNTIAAKEMCNGDHSIRCTVSLGIACLAPNKSKTTEAIITNADFALYEAKRRGRNQTVLFKDGMTICHVCKVDSTDKC